jgi:hypothetical protein
MTLSYCRHLEKRRPAIRHGGRLDILYRRIGRNELDAIQSCLA